MKIQMLPLMIKDAVKESNQIRIDKCNFILSDLFNIYNAIKEYINFSKDEDFKKLRLFKEKRK